jgi:RNA polymerase sigma-70 factor (ECF subfamily)
MSKSDNVLPFRRPEQRGLSDESLVLACAGGDGRALEELFYRHGAQVNRLLGRLGHVDRRDLDDLVQVTFLEVHRSARRFSGRSAVSTWILSVALNVARHHARSEARRRIAMAGVARATVAGEAHRPDDRATHRQSLERLRIGIESLPYDFRVVFLLCDIEGLKGTEAAQALAIPEGTVWRRLHEARTRLRAFVGLEIDR